MCVFVYVYMCIAICVRVHACELRMYLCVYMCISIICVCVCVYVWCLCVCIQKGGPITLWCDGKSRESREEDHRGKRKRDNVVEVGRRQEREEVESVYKELQESTERSLTPQGFACGHV